MHKVIYSKQCNNMKELKYIIVALAILLFLPFGSVFAQMMQNHENYINKMVAKTKNDASYRHISVLGCNLGNSYDVFSANLKNKGFKLVKNNTDPSVNENKTSDRYYSWKGNMSGRNVGLQIDCCGKYIVGIWMHIGCNSEEDEGNTWRNVLSSLNKKYGNYTRKNSYNRYWDKHNVMIRLFSSSYGLGIIKEKQCVVVYYEDLIYVKWINEYKKQIKNQKNKRERKAFEENL